MKKFRVKRITGMGPWDKAYGKNHVFTLAHSLTLEGVTYVTPLLGEAEQAMGFYSIHPDIREDEIVWVEEEKQVKYKHHDIVLAWLNGEEIEGRSSRNSPWEEIIPAEDASIVPYFDANWEFRIKPKTKTV